MSLLLLLITSALQLSCNVVSSEQNTSGTAVGGTTIGASSSGPNFHNLPHNEAQLVLKEEDKSYWSRILEDGSSFSSPTTPSTPTSPPTPPPTPPPPTQPPLTPPPTPSPTPPPTESPTALGTCFVNVSAKNTVSDFRYSPLLSRGWAYDVFDQY